MLPPGGGSNLITSRLTRHMLLITLDSFEDNTLNKIFCTIMDWHLAKGFVEVLVRAGKVRYRRPLNPFGRRMWCAMRLLVAGRGGGHHGGVQGGDTELPADAVQVPLLVQLTGLCARHQGRAAGALQPHEGDEQAGAAVGARDLPRLLRPPRRRSRQVPACIIAGRARGSADTNCASPAGSNCSLWCTKRCTTTIGCTWTRCSPTWATSPRARSWPTSTPRTSSSATTWSPTRTPRYTTK